MTKTQKGRGIRFSKLRNVTVVNREPNTSVVNPLAKRNMHQANSSITILEDTITNFTTRLNELARATNELTHKPLKNTRDQNQININKRTMQLLIVKIQNLRAAQNNKVKFNKLQNRHTGGNPNEYINNPLLRAVKKRHTLKRSYGKRRLINSNNTNNIVQRVLNNINNNAYVNTNNNALQRILNDTMYNQNVDSSSLLKGSSKKEQKEFIEITILSLRALILSDIETYNSLYISSVFNKEDYEFLFSNKIDSYNTLNKDLKGILETADKDIYWSIENIIGKIITHLEDCIEELKQIKESNDITDHLEILLKKLEELDTLLENFDI